MIKKFISILFLFAVLTNPLFSQVQIGSNIIARKSMTFSNDGTRLATGAPGSGSGRVKIYDLTDGKWIQIGQDIDGQKEWNEVGKSISLSGDGMRLAVAGIDGIADLADQARIYEFVDGEWIQLGQTIHGDGLLDSNSPVAFSLDGSSLIIGGYSDEFTGSPTRVYELIEGTWTQVGQDIESPGYDNLGSRVSLSADGNRVALSVLGGDFGVGSVHIYEWSGGLWMPVGQIIEGEAVFEWFAYAISLSSDGNRVAIGTPRKDGNGDLSGIVQIFEWTENEWTQLGQDLQGTGALDFFGEWVSLSSDGNRLAIGADEWNPTTEADPGYVQIYELMGDTWVQFGETIFGEMPGSVAGNCILSPDGSKVATMSIGNDGMGGTTTVAKVFQLENINATDNQNTVHTFTVSPNPSSGSIKIDLGKGQGSASVIVRNTLGQVVFTSDKINLPIVELDLNSNKGVHYIEIRTTDNQVWVSKVLIE